MNELSGLPTHPMLVHLAVVAIPVVALAAIAVAARTTWLRRWGLHVAIASVLMTIYTAFVMESGEHLDDAMDLGAVLDDHRSLAETSRLLVVAMCLAVISLVTVDRLWSGGRRTGQAVHPAAATVRRLVGGLTMAISVLAIVWIVRTGHAGARVTWTGVLDS